MNILILAAGLGTKFEGTHFDHKSLIPVNGQPMLITAIKSLEMDKDEGNNFIFLIPSDSDIVSKLEPEIRKAFPTNCRVVVVNDALPDFPYKPKEYVLVCEIVSVVSVFIVSPLHVLTPEYGAIPFLVITTVLGSNSLASTTTDIHE